MEKKEILNQLTTIFREVLDNNSIVLYYETIAKDIEEWDSLEHILLIVASEKHFNIRFTPIEIKNFKNVGDFCDKIKSKLINE